MHPSMRPRRWIQTSRRVSGGGQRAQRGIQARGPVVEAHAERWVDIRHRGDDRVDDAVESELVGVGRGRSDQGPRPNANNALALVPIPITRVRRRAFDLPRTTNAT